MKVGILTYHRAINYGAVMQSFALVNKLSKDFSDDSFEIIDYNCRKREVFIYKCPIVFLYRRSICEAFQKVFQTIEFKKALKSLRLSKKNVGVSAEKINDFISKNYDMVIVGSDAVFNWSDIGLPNAYFLTDINVKYKMAYAASAHLQNYNNITEQQKSILGLSLKAFNYIGVRDDSTRNFVEYYTDCAVTTEHNCDPSIFLKMDFSELNLQKKLKKHRFDFNKKTVFVMLMNASYGEFARKYFGDEVQIVALMDGNKFADIYLYDLNPFEWAHVFKYGSFLVTDYFHGTIFGLKNQIPVLSIDSSNYTNIEAGYESKAKDLLFRRLNLPFIYLDGRELQRENGYERFTEQIDIINREFDSEIVLERIEKESKSYDDFADAYRLITEAEK